MSIFSDIDATCSALGYHDGTKYHVDEDFLQCLKHLIWILRRDGETHDYRRYIGQKQIVATDLIPMLDCADDAEVADVLLRLLVNLTNPALLLYREELPRDNVGRRNFLELVEILQKYKESFCQDGVWSLLAKRLEKVLEIDWAERSEEQGLLIERILVLVRNVLQVPADPNLERRTDNDANVHDQLVWSLHQSGLLDIVLYVISSEYEQAYHLHSLEIIFLVFREQEAKPLAEAAIGRSEAEKYREEQELLMARERERSRTKDIKKLPGRHSRFGGTYVVQNLKSISDNPIICHRALEHVVEMNNFDANKQKQKKNFRIAPEDKTLKRRSALSVRLMLREFCVEILRSAYNSMVRNVKRVLERSADHGGHDDSYLLWAVRFFMEFNRYNGFQIDLVSESLSTSCFYWVVARMQHHMEMITSDKKKSRLWGKRLHIAMQTYKELIFNLQVLQKMPDEKSQALFSILQNNVFYLYEYREIVLHLLINYDERHSTKAYLRDVMETAAFYFKLMEKFCDGRVVVQDKAKKKKQKKRRQQHGKQQKQKQHGMAEEDLQTIWDSLSPSLAAVIGGASEISLPEEDHPIPFDAAADKGIDDQKGDCMVRIHSFLRDEKFDKGVLLLRAAREVWPENDHFGTASMAPEDELLLMREIFFANLPKCPNNDPNDDNSDDDNAANDSYDEEDDGPQTEEKQIHFEDFIKRLVNPKVVRACTYVLTEWETMHPRTLKAVVTILHKIAVGCKVPAMLYQAKLFRIFQAVLAAKRTTHNVELKKFATFIVRDFVATVPENPKIYAELLFYKSVHEAELIKNGYKDDECSKGKASNKWNDQQEDELRRLFMQNQESPETEEDVIDWLARNLIDQSRTRRQIIMKLKSLGLIFKAPTKRSNYLAANKKLWTAEQDERLKDLYDQFRLEENCLERIMETMSLFKTQNVVISRMIALGCIADRSEILPQKKKKGKKRTEEYEVEQNGESPKKRKQTGKLDGKRAKVLLSELEDSHKEAVDWLIESLTDALDDVDDMDDGIPIVPLSELQMDAVRNDTFSRLMLSLGLQSPDEMETYWRIPAGITDGELRNLVKILKNEEINDDQESDDEEEDAENMFGIWRQQANNALVYHESDNETSMPVKKARIAKPKKVKPQIADFALNEDKEEPEDDLMISSQQIRSRLNELMDSDSDSDDNEKNEKKEEESKEPPTRKRSRDFSLNSDDDDDDEPTVRKPKSKRMVLSDDDDDDDDD